MTPQPKLLMPQLLRAYWWWWRWCIEPLRLLVWSGCLRGGDDRLHLLRVVAISAGLWVLLLLVLRVLGLLVILLLLGVLFLRLALDLAGSTACLHVLELAVGCQAGVVLGAAEILAVLMENDGGNDERSDKCKAGGVLGVRAQQRIKQEKEELTR